jgi:hypothetical protein
MNLYRNNITIGDIPQLDVVVPEFFPKTGLVSYYKLDGNSNDSVGSNNGTDTSISYSAGKISNAASFNGSSSYINLPSDISKLFEGTNKYTFSCWAKFNNFSSMMFLLTSITSTASSYPNRNLIIFSNDSGGLEVQRYNGSTSNNASTASGIISTGIYYHIVVTYDGALLKIYVNNVEKVSISATLNASNGGYSCLGKLIQNNSNYYYLNGNIDEVGIWSRALTSDEITQLYNNGNGLTY